MQAMGDAAVGHYTCRPYFLSLDHPLNQALVEKFRSKLVKDVVITDTMAKAFTQIYMWKQIVEAYSNVYGLNKNLQSVVDQRTRFLNERKERYQMMSDLNEESIVIHQEGTLIDINKAFSEIFGYSEKDLLGSNPVHKIFTPASARIVKEKFKADFEGLYELQGKTFRDIIHPDDLHVDFDHIKKVIAGKMDSFEIEKRCIHKNGNVIWIKLFSNVMRDYDGNVLYTIAAVADITEQKQMELALIESKERYQNLVNIFRTLSTDTNFSRSGVLPMFPLRQKWLRGIRPRNIMPIRISSTNWYTPGTVIYFTKHSKTDREFTKPLYADGSKKEKSVVSIEQ